MTAVQRLQAEKDIEVHDWSYEESYKHIQYGTTEIQLNRMKKYILTLGDPVSI
ncbi:hypothetical protein T552_01803 [Pneumocystis carinii B80]|uniref:Uncharacterized protein n=1 Tax=Pneumocystis carinii (strain B80) TaxID=1408658 RepID=A0A0W4ZJJ7_PNEC8|nr:hypothetical protein T552_01803 [Pneumocystis carinii B80]KTW28543.1 hypothetical protein T552_01803 [Pneumocystis carinii B80]